MSPKVTRRDDAMVLNVNDMIRGINEMNQVIKGFYKKVKMILHEEATYCNCNCNSVRNVVDNVDMAMKMFVIDVKKCFANLKQLTKQHAIGSPVRNDIRDISTPKMVSQVRNMSPQQHKRNNNNSNNNNKAVSPLGKAKKRVVSGVKMNYHSKSNSGYAGNVNMNMNRNGSDVGKVSIEFEILAKGMKSNYTKLSEIALKRKKKDL
jgi:hypothetical protein